MNLHYVNRYKRFIERCKQRYLNCDDYIEHHHIIPQSIGGDDCSDNIISLTGREHYIAHWIRAKAYGGNMWFAFWMMNTDTRNKHNRYVNSIGYEISRKNHSIEISKNRKNYVTCFDSIQNRFVSITVDEFHKNTDRYSHVSKGKAVYKINDKHVVLSVNDPLVTNCIAVSIRCGYKHPQSTIDKMIKNNKIRNKVIISNESTNESMYIDKDSDLPDGFHFGPLQKSIDKVSKTNQKLFKTIKWITNGQTNMRIKITSESDIPEGFYLGRTIEKKTCEYCGKTVDIGNYAQHHGERCKHKGE